MAGRVIRQPELTIAHTAKMSRSGREFLETTARMMAWIEAVPENVMKEATAPVTSQTRR